MSDMVITMEVADAVPGQAQGIKEALAMDMEKYGGTVRVLQVEIREPEQMGMEGGGRPRNLPPPPLSYDPPHTSAPKKAGAAGRKPGLFACCYTCGQYHYQPGRDPDGAIYWGLCQWSGKPVYDLKKKCSAWERGEAKL